MSAVSDAERAVAEARSRVIVYLTSAGLSTARATANADALITAVRAHDAELARADRGEDAEVHDMPAKKTAKKTAGKKTAGKQTAAKKATRKRAG